MDLLALRATLGLDSKDYDSGLERARSNAVSVGGAIASGLKIGVAAIGAAATAVGFLVKKSVDSYSEFQQLEGGVRKLYGSAASEVMKNAQEAYKTAGMSANQYMEQATSFSAALIGSLNGDVQKAAKQTDVAMRAISDNVNTFGSDMGSVQYAFQGFAKQNYTMLDNLKLGYGGTKTEMERLIDDANEYAESIGLASDLSIESFSDIVTAIDLIQQKQGIAKTTSAEAASTISGSMGSMKAAWENLLTGMSDPDADMGKLIDNMVETAITSIDNLVPTIERALNGVATLIENLAPVISDKLPSLISQILPKLISAGISLIAGVVSALPEIISALISAIPTVVTAIAKALSAELQTKVSGELASAFRVAIKFLIKLIDHADTLGPIILGVATALGVFAVAINIATTIAKTTAAMKGFFLLLSANPIGLIVAAIAGLVVAFITLYKHNEKFREFVNALWEKIKTVIAEAISKVQEILGKVKEVFENIKNTVTTAWETIVNVVQFAFSAIQAIIETAVTILLIPWQFIWGNFGTTITDAWEAIKNIISTALNVISGVISSVFGTIYSVITTILSSVAGFISSIMGSISAVISSVWNSIASVVSSVLSRISSVVSSVWGAISSRISSAMSGIRNIISSGMNAAKGVVSGVLNAISSKFTSIFNTVKSTVGNAINHIKGLFNFSWSLPHISLPHFSVSGGVAPWGFGGKGSLPSVSVSWYKKAMDDAYLLDGATFFGSANGKLLGGGEAGREIIIGEQKALDMISEASGSKELLGRMNYLIQLLECYLPKRTYPDGKELDRMLGVLV